MALTDLILKKGQVILTQNAASQVGVELQNSPFLFGNVVRINDLSDMYAVNDYVMFDPTGATKFKISVTEYFLTTEDKIIDKEDYIPV